MQHKKAEYFSYIENFIDDYKDSHGGAAPTTYEIAGGIGLSQSSVVKYLRAMRESGMIDYGGSRNIETALSRRDAREYCRVPVLGAVSCGLPKLAEENIEEFVRLPVSLLGRGSFFALRAKGDSMINAGIDDGDIVLVRQQNSADYDQIVVALVDDEATLKRFRPENGIFRLHAENPDYDDIIVESCLVQGVAVKVIKDLK